MTPSTPLETLVLWMVRYYYEDLLSFSYPMADYPGPHEMAQLIFSAGVSPDIELGRLIRDSMEREIAEYDDSVRQKQVDSYTRLFGRIEDRTRELLAWGENWGSAKSGWLGAQPKDNRERAKIRDAIRLENALRDGLLFDYFCYRFEALGRQKSKAPLLFRHWQTMSRATMGVEVIVKKEELGCPYVVTNHPLMSIAHIPKPASGLIAPLRIKQTMIVP